jgi:putative intracellular protease/amidase
MMTQTVHVAVFDTFADWETGYATAHIRRDSWQRQPGRYSVTTVGPTREPVTTMGGMRIAPDIALDELRPSGSAMLILAGGDTWGEDSMAGFRTAARRFLAAGVPVAAICGATFGLALEGCWTTARTPATTPGTSRSPATRAAAGTWPGPR